MQCDFNVSSCVTAETNCRAGERERGKRREEKKLDEGEKKNAMLALFGRVLEDKKVRPVEWRSTRLVRKLRVAFRCTKLRLKNFLH